LSAKEKVQTIDTFAGLIQTQFGSNITVFKGNEKQKGLIKGTSYTMISVNAKKNEQRNA
jgi:hypothetical protein